jgi:manganese oxidase
MARRCLQAVLVPVTALMLVVATARAQVPAGHPCSARGAIVRADVAAIDFPIVFNRLGAQNVNWQMYALWRDLVHTSSGPEPKPLPALDALTPDERKKLPGKVTLRPDLRPRPVVLRVAAGQCLQLRFTNLLTSISNPRNGDETFAFDHPSNHRSLVKELPADHDPSEKVNIAQIDDQVASRLAGFHPAGLEWVRGAQDDSSLVGGNASSLAAPGQTREYLFYAPKEGAYLVTNPGAAFGGEGTAGTSGTGLFGMVAVQPSGARAYRGQVTEEELRLATRTDPSGQALRSPQGHPVMDYEARYPDDCASNGVWCREGKNGAPILAMVFKGEIVHGDINAVIVGPNEDGSFPPQTYPLESEKARNPTLPNRLEPFREFASIYHDENAAAQAFPKVFEHPVLGHTLHGVRDAFMINYGSAGVGAEVIANRLRVGPMHDCVDCAFEEFFLSSFAVGDPALLVDKPANIGLEGIDHLLPARSGQCAPQLFGRRGALSQCAHRQGTAHLSPAQPPVAVQPQ